MNAGWDGRLDLMSRSVAPTRFREIRCAQRVGDTRTKRRVPETGEPALE